MYLKSLELSGFKSFAKKACLSFTSPITVIVGPNGSGKSNVAEAFRFVLGEQSIKSLRGKRGEDMIWNGGGATGSIGSLQSGSARSNRAAARLVFDNSRKIFNSLDFDEVSVERVVHRDNSNEYLLNGSQVRLKDIVESLAGAHIGATGHHIISQGEADKILSASIRERREMIEDALGLKIYQWKKTESIRKLERTEENMKQVESLRREIAPHLTFLKKQVEKVEKAEEMRRELVALYREYFAREEYYLNAEKEKLNREISGPRKELAELDRDLNKAKEILTASKNKDGKSGEVVKLENELNEIRNKKDGITRELGRIEGEISANNRAIEKEKEKSRREETKTVYLKDVEEVLNTVESFRPIEDAKKLFSEILNALKSFIARHKSSGDSRFIVETEKEVAALLKQKTGFESELSELNRTEAELKGKYDQLKNNIEKEKDINKEAEKDVFRIIARQNEVRNVVANLSSRLESLVREEEALKRELVEAGIIAGREATAYSVNVARAAQSVEPREVVESPSTAISRTSVGDKRIAPRLDNELRSVQAERLKKIEKIKVRLEDASGSGGAETMKEYRETEERDAFLSRELEDLGKAEDELRKLIAELDVRIDVEFKNGIMKINSEFQKYFALMFGGGRAELVVVKEPGRREKSDAQKLSEVLTDPTMSDIDTAGSETDGPEGIDVNISLPRKKVKGLMMLSGGERALTSIALLFAVSQVNPPPFIVLDETDAALDEANSRKYGDMIEQLSEHSQLILITHNRETMSRAGVIYGVTMGSDGASKLLSIQFEEAVKVAK